jgi:hypothetical protein
MRHDFIAVYPLPGFVKRSSASAYYSYFVCTSASGKIPGYSRADPAGAAKYKEFHLDIIQIESIYCNAIKGLPSEPVRFSGKNI